MKRILSEEYPKPKERTGVASNSKEVVSLSFVQRSEKTGPPLYGRVRYNSKFE